jgi:hypothetical protein
MRPGTTIHVALERFSTIVAVGTATKEFCARY